MNLRRRAAMAAAAFGFGAGLVRPAAADALAVIALAPPAGGGPGLQAALARRRSVRSYGPGPLALPDVAALLWAAQGITGAEGRRTAPSAGALYPLELLLAARRVTGLAPGVYRYRPGAHALERTLDEPGAALARSAGGQASLAGAPAVLAIVADPARTAAKYAGRTARYVAIEAGAAAQNVALQAAALGLGTVVVGAFADEALARALGLGPALQPLVLMPVGRMA